MLNRFRNVVSNVMGGIAAIPDQGEKQGLAAGGTLAVVPSPFTGKTAGSPQASPEPALIRFVYNRPEFLQLNMDEIQVSADHVSRPILVPRDISRLPWNTGYAEVINAGKTKLNEDQARAGTYFVPKEAPDPSTPSPEPMEEAGVYHDIQEVKPNSEDKGLNRLDKKQNSYEDQNQNQQLRNVEDEAMEGSNHGYSQTVQRESGSFSDLSSEFDMVSADPLPFSYFGVFDGHAGTGAAIMAVNCLHLHLQNQLIKVREMLIGKRYNFDSYMARGQGSASKSSHPLALRDKTSSITADELVIGALESAFHNMDAQIAQERLKFKITGGCTALVAMFFMGKLYVANAGDCRAVLCRGEEVIPLSSDFTPESERQRIQYLGSIHPELLHNEFTHLEFARRVSRKDIGRQIMYRDACMKGWSFKTICEEDTRFPLIYGEGKRARVLATIGVTRGFGDHDLRVHDSNILIKPFLTPTPEVQVYDMTSYDHNENDVLIMGSDGLWDVTSNEKAAHVVRNCIQQFAPDDRSRYTSAAQELVMNARGLLKKGWRTLENRPASGDDITALVIPLHRYTQTVTESSSTESSLDAS